MRLKNVYLLSSLLKKPLEDVFYQKKEVSHKTHGIQETKVPTQKKGKEDLPDDAKGKT